MSKPKTEHSTLEAYIVGFILSLIFTLIPYYLVVSRTVTGNTLLFSILGFGLMQMLVQVFFFLHLGRGPKPFYNVVFFVATFGAILVVVGGSVVIINNLHSNMATSDQVKKLVNDEGIYQVGGKQTGACEGLHSNHQVIIQDGKVTPSYTYANICDTLTFINKDDQTRDMAFGEHAHHEAYAGRTEFSLRKGKNETITLSESGTYRFHDHLNDATAGYLTVEP